MRYLIIAIFFIACTTGKIITQSNDADILIKNARIITGYDSVFEKASLLVKGNKIVLVDRSNGDHNAKTVIDASGKTVLPGLIDAHAHIFFSPRFPLQLKSNEEISSFITSDLPNKLNEYLSIGVTSLFSPGDYWPFIKSVKNDLNAGKLKGPRLFICGPIITANGGHPAVTVCDGSQWCKEHLSRQIDNIAVALNVINEIKSDVDAIKIVYDDGRRIKYNQLQDSIVEAIIRISHEAKLPVYAHAPSDSRSIRLIKMGIDGLLHAPVQSVQDYPQIQQTLINSKVPITTTLSVLAPFVSDSGTRLTYFGAPYPDQMEERLTTALNNLKDLINNRLIVGFGTDTPMQPPRISYYKEMEVLQKAGMSNMEIFQLMTLHTAKFLKKDKLIGSIEENKLADLLIVNGNPLGNLTDLKSVWLVIKDGNIIVDKR